MQAIIKKCIHAGLFVGIFLFFRFGVDPRLIYHVQEPPFISDLQFFLPFSKYPGGMVWYAGAFLTQFYQFPWAGAIVITLIILCCYRLTALFLGNIGIDDRHKTVRLLPVLLLLAGCCDYLFPLSYALVIFVVLLFSDLYFFLSLKKSWHRSLLFVTLVPAAYYLTGTGALVFAVICGMYEFLLRKNYPGGGIILAIAALIPLIAAQYVFVITVPSAYGEYIGLKTYLLEAAQYPRTPAQMYGLYLFFPALVVARHFVSVYSRKHHPKRTTSGKRRTVLGREPVRSGAVLIIFFCAAWYFFNSKEKANYRVDYCARHQCWETIIREVTPARLTDYSVLSQMHLFRALYYRNRLLDDLFVYPGALPGRSFMMVTGQMATYYPVQMSDCCFETGALNQAKYWAHEALALKGKKPWILQRLALINIVQGEKRSAEKFIALLGRTPFYRDSALALRHLCENDSLFQRNDYLKRITSYVRRREYLCRDFYSELVNLFENSSDNRIAFEYIVAENLLNNSISPVVDNTGYFKRFGFRRLPRHVQEAVVFQQVMAGSNSATFSGFQIDSRYFRGFKKFNRTLLQYQNDRNRALEILAPGYGTTYWFYLASSNRPALLRESK